MSRGMPVRHTSYDCPPLQSPVAADSFAHIGWGARKTIVSIPRHPGKRLYTPREDLTFRTSHLRTKSVACFIFGLLALRSHAELTLD